MRMQGDHMRVVVFAATTLLAIGGSAAAADLAQPLYKGPMPPPVMGWTGLYVGLNAGGGIGSGRSDFNVSGIPFASVTNSLSGAIGGGQVGFNWQTGIVVAGVEADFQASSLNGNLTAPCPFAVCALLPLSATYSQKVEWFGTARGRLGVATSGWLIYATAGYAYARLDTDATATAGPASASLSMHDNRNGWTAGGGIEVALAPNWSARLEYLYLNFGKVSTTWVLAGLPAITDNARFDMNVVRAGVNYRF
jgi:opacity protein-like surface antigen